MREVTPTANIMYPEFTPESRIETITKIATIARKCYKSKSNGVYSDVRLVKMLVEKGHWAMLEHATVSVEFICDRGIANEIVRHRLAAYAQESTRYCNYSQDKFDGEISTIRPYVFANGSESYRIWREAMYALENAYFALLDEGNSPEWARSVLGLSTKTEMAMTANLREWKHFFDLRADGIAGTPHPQMLEIVLPLKRKFQEWLPEVFGTEDDA